MMASDIGLAVLGGMVLFAGGTIASAIKSAAETIAKAMREQQRKDHGR